MNRFLLLILLAFLIVLGVSLADKFEIFGCGRGDKLGIGDSNPSKITTLTKVVLDDKIKTSKLYSLRSSSHVHHIETADHQLYWGLHENQRISYKYFLDKPKLTIPEVLLANSTFCTDTSQFLSGFKLKHLILDDYAYEIARDPTIDGQVFPDYSDSLCFAGYLPQIEMLVSKTSRDIQYAVTLWDNHLPIPRSLHKRLTVYSLYDKSRRLIYPGLTPYPMENQQCSGQSSCELVKIAQYMDFEIFLEKNMNLVANKNSRKDTTSQGLAVASFNPELIGIAKKTDEYDTMYDIRPLWAIWNEYQLQFNTSEGFFQKFRNIFNGPYSTIAVTLDKRLLAWGANNFNMLGLNGNFSNQEIIFPPQIIQSLPAVEEIKQISIGFTHTLVLLKNSTVLGIGSNINGELGRNDSDIFKTFIKIQFPSFEEACLAAKTCSIELIAAEKDVSFIVFNYGTENNVQITPTCFGKSHIDVDACSMNGICIRENQCSCFLGYFGAECNISKSSCPQFDNCSGNGRCNENNQGCECYSYAKGTNCSTPVCGEYVATEEKSCSGHGKCVFERGNNSIGAKCVCDSGYDGNFCADGMKNLQIYTIDPPSSFELTRVSFKHTQTSEKDSVMKLFSASRDLAVFVVDNHIHIVGMSDTVIGDSMTSAITNPKWRFENLKFSTIAAFMWVQDNQNSWRKFGFSTTEPGEFYDFSEKSTNTMSYMETYNTALFYFSYISGGSWVNSLDSGITSKTTKYQTLVYKGNPIQLAKKCHFYDWRNGMKLLGLSTGGIAFISDIIGLELNSTSVDNVLIDPTKNPILDVKCVGFTAMIKNKDGWFYKGYPSSGHSSNDFDQSNFNVQGQTIIQQAIGSMSSYLITKSSSGKNNLWFVGSSSKGVNTTLVRVAEDIAFSSVMATAQGKLDRFYFGTWEESKDYESCGAFPSILTGLVCCGHGSCINRECKCNQGFRNINEIDNGYHKFLVDVMNFNIFGFRPIGSISSIFQVFSTFHKVKECGITEAGLDLFDILAIMFVGTLIPIAIIIILLCFAAIGGIAFVVSVVVTAVVAAFFLGFGCGPPTLILICLIACVLLCAVIIVIILILCLTSGGFAVVIGVPTTILILICCLLSVGCCGFYAAFKIFKRLREKENKLMFDKLMESDKMGKSKKDADEFTTSFDMSLFNLDFKDFKIIEELATGGSGALCLHAINKKDDEHVFIKLFILKKKNGENNFELGEFKTEITMFTRLRHPNIVNFFGLFYSPPSRFGYVCEFCKDGSLHRYLEKISFNEKNRKKFNLQKKLDWLIQIGKGMRYLHQKDVIFRDLKPQNILIGKNDMLKLTDFGISKISAKDQSQMTQSKGTSFYMAPEVVNGLKYNQSVDVFSYSMVMYQVLFETIEPFGSDTNQFGIEFTVSRDPNFRPIIEFGKLEKLEKSCIPEDIETRIMRLMERCWDHNPINRPNFREIVADLSEIQDSWQIGD